MAKTLHITIPDAIHASLTNEGAELGQEPGEVIKTGLLVAYKAPEGWTLNLKPVNDPAQIELPLGGARRRLSEWLN